MIVGPSSLPTSVLPSFGAAVGATVGLGAAVGATLDATELLDAGAVVGLGAAVGGTAVGAGAQLAMIAPSDVVPASLMKSRRVNFLRDIEIPPRIRINLAEQTVEGICCGWLLFPP
jgi:hypothetical protein